MAPEHTPPSELPPLSWRAEADAPKPFVDDGHPHAPRRPMPVAHVLVVGVVCLLVGALLNAPGIHKTALGQPVGWKRDVARFFAEPLDEVSHDLFLDRPRRGIQELIGRAGDDDVNLALPSPTLPSTETTPNTLPLPTTTTLPPKPAFSPTRPMRLWLGGDSLSVTPGESVINLVSVTGVITPLGPVDGHVSTGLARPEVFNWPAALAGIAASAKPDVMVLTFGSNDDQTLTGDGGGQAFGSDGWQAEYHRRVGGLMDQVIGGGITLFWVGIPPMANVARYTDRYQLINDIVRQEAQRRPGRVAFVDTAAVLGSPDGGYAPYLPNPDGALVQVRTTDGIHFTRAGGDRVAAAVYAAMQSALDLTSWQQAASSTTTAPSSITTSTLKRRTSGK